jgi:D-alanyl-D-alanine carboxypeptidase
VKTALAILMVSFVAVGASSAQATGGPASINRDQPVSAARAHAIDRAAANFLATSADGAPGLWLAVWDPKRGYYEQAYGRAVAGGRKAAINDVFYIGSITKTALATAVLQQVAKGKIKLSDTVAELDPGLAMKFPTIASIDVRSLLGMTSGIPDYADAAVAQVLLDPQKRFSRDELITLGLASGEQRPIGTPEYSTTNFIILGKLLASVTKRTPERLVTQVFRRAGMTDARLPFPGTKQPARIAHGYAGKLLSSQLQGLAVPDATADLTSWSFDWGREGGGAYATIGELATWGSTCLGNAFLPKNLVRQRLLTRANDAGDYGLGIIRQGNWLSHTGQTLGWMTNVACNPKTGAVVAYATNSTYGNIDVPQRIGKAAFPEYLKASGG